MAIETHTQTYELKNGNGSTAAFSFSFPLYDSTNELDDVFVYVWNTSTLVWDLKTVTTHYNIAGTTVTFTSGNIPASGTGNILISRSTDIKLPKADYVAGSAVKSQDLDNNQTQTLYALQELKDTKVDHKSPKVLANLDVDSNKIINVATPTAATDAASKGYVDSAVSIAATVGDTAPTNPSQGDRWYDSASGRTFIYYTDADSSQWVDSSPPLDSGVGGSGGTASQNVFKTIKVTSGGSSTDVVADGTTDTFEMIAGSNVTLTPDATNDKVTITSTATSSIGDGDKGDIAVSNSGATWTIDSDVVTYAKMQNTSTPNRVLGAASAGDIGEIQVATDMIAADAVTSDKLKDDPSGAAGAVTTDHIRDNAVNLAKLEDGTQGDILYYGASGAPARLAKGTAGKVLTMNSGATAPEWATATGGGSGDIEGVTAGTGLTGGGTSGTVTVNVDVGTVANKIVQLDGNAKLPTVDASNITALNAGQLTTGTIPDARFPATLPAVSGANLTNISADSMPTGFGWVNVRDYNAKGDDSTDDKAAIQNAIDALKDNSDSKKDGGVVYFPPGIYRISGPLVLGNSHHNIRLEGIGGPPFSGNQGGPILRKTVSDDDHIEISNSRNIRIEGLTFDYSGSHGSSNGGAAINAVSTNDCQSLYFHQLRTDHISNGIKCHGYSEVVIRDVMIKSQPHNSGSSYGIEFDQGSDTRQDSIRVENVIIDARDPNNTDDEPKMDMNSYTDGFRVKNFSNTIWFINCQALKCKNGINFDSSMGNSSSAHSGKGPGSFHRIENCDLEGSKEHGIYINGGDFIWVQNTYATSNLKMGLKTGTSFKGNLTINSIDARGNGNSGMYLGGTDMARCEIMNPHCYDNNQGSNIGGSNNNANDYHGIQVADGVDNISILGGKCGGQSSGKDTSSRQHTGIMFIGNDHKNISIANVNVTGNHNSGIGWQNAGNNNNSSSNNFIRHCPGYHTGQTSFP